jgi:hypothetical protein
MSDLYDRTIITQLNELKQRVADLSALDTIKIDRTTGLPYFTALTAGSVLFAGTSGLLAQDNANLFWDDTNNRLGIGTTVPAFDLEVKKAQPTIAVNWTNTANYGYVGFAETGALKSFVQHIGSTFAITARRNWLEVFNTSASGGFSIWTNSTQRVWVDSSGNVGIGTAPSYPLHVIGNGVFSGDIYWGTGSNWLSAYLNQAVLTSSSPTFQEHYANGWFRSNTSGAGWYHQVHGGGIYMDDGTMVKCYNSVGFAALGNSGFGLLTQPSTARLVARGANTSSSNQALLVQNSTPSNLMLIRNDGGAGSTQVIVAWTVTSDKAVKKNVKNEAKGLAELLQIQPRIYDRTDVEKTNEHGFVAQELQPIFPELVNTVEGGMLGIAYTELIPVLVKAIQELAAEVAIIKNAPVK